MTAEQWGPTMGGEGIHGRHWWVRQTHIMHNFAYQQGNNTDTFDSAATLHVEQESAPALFLGQTEYNLRELYEACKTED